jgi:lipopolysaccharide transport system permease protein
MSELLAAARPTALVRYYQRHRYLLWRLVRREVEVRYRGTWLGPAWALLTPLLMLMVYTFVFAYVFQIRWGDSGASSTMEFALALFAGLTAFNVFAETLHSSPGLISGNVNYVKKVVFPLELLPLAKFIGALVQGALSFGVLLLACLVVRGELPWTAGFLPVVLLPLALWSLGCAYFLAPLGVLVRDVGQMVGLVVTVLLFMSAVFFPIERIPPPWQSLMMFNPLVPVIDDVRRVLLGGLPPKWAIWGATTGFGWVFLAAALAWFGKVKKLLADAV